MDKTEIVRQVTHCSVLCPPNTFPVILNLKGGLNSIVFQDSPCIYFLIEKKKKKKGRDFECDLSGD